MTLAPALEVPASEACRVGEEGPRASAGSSTDSFPAASPPEAPDAWALSLVGLLDPTPRRVGDVCPLPRTGEEPLLMLAVAVTVEAALAGAAAALLVECFCMRCVTTLTERAALQPYLAPRPMT